MKTKILKMSYSRYYLFFLEMYKMINETLINIVYSKYFKAFAVTLIEKLHPIAFAAENASVSNINEYNEYTKELTKLLERFAAKKEEGGFDIDETGKINVPESVKAEYSVAIEELLNKYKNALIERQKEVEAISKFLNSEVEVELPTISMTHVSEYITAEQMKFIKDLINDE